MNTWFKVRVTHRDEFVIESVNVPRETEHFIYVEEKQNWGGNEVVRQRRVAKKGAWFSASYYPTKMEAIQALYEKETARITRLEKDLSESQHRKLKLLQMFDEAKQEQAT